MKPPLAQSPEDLQDLHTLCRLGRLYEVEDWIRADLPIQLGPKVPIRGRYRSALEIALETGQHSLSLLLLRSGYQPDLNRTSSFDIALGNRRWDLVDLLFEFGADPHRVNLTTLFDTYKLAIFDRFYEAGVSLTADHAVAEALAYHPGNKPLFGFAKRRRSEQPAIQEDLDIALGYHVQEGKEKGIMLAIWAGADPHAPVRDLEFGSDDDPEEFETAVEQAAYHGNVKALRIFEPDPSRIDFDRLYGRAANGEVVRFLAGIQSPHNLDGIVHSLSFNAAIGWCRDRQWKDALLAVLGCGVRWERAERNRLAGIRRDLLKGANCDLRDLLVALRSPEVCAPEIFEELTRTQAMQKRMLDIGLIKPHLKPPSKAEIRRREVASFSDRYDRAKLYEEVWAQPVTRVAEAYGVSGVYLARACRVLRVPVPPRGHWARVRAGRRTKRPRLPILRSS